MNPLNSNPFRNNFSPNQFSNMDQLRNNIRNIKEVMRLANGDPKTLIPRFPSLGPVLQMAQGQDLQGMYMSMCRDLGIDPNVILNELRN